MPDDPPRRRETSVGPITSVSVWHWSHRRDRRDTAYCIGQLSESGTSLTPPIIPTLVHFAGVTQALTWPQGQEPLSITRSQKKWSPKTNHVQSLGEALQFLPDHSSGSRADDQRARRASLFCQTRCAVLRQTDLPIHLGVRPCHAYIEMDRRIRTTGVEHPEDMTRHLSDKGNVAIETDTFSVRVCPPDSALARLPFGRLRLVLISQAGTTPGELGSLNAVPANDIAKSVFEDFQTRGAFRTRVGIDWPTFNFFSKHELTRARRISKHPRSSNLLRISVYLKIQGSPSDCGPTGGHTS